jgi:hypothetical protein
MSMYRLRLMCCMDLGGNRSRLGAPGDAVHRGLAHSGRTGADRETKGMGSSVAAEEEELAAGGAVDVQCSRAAVVGGDAVVEDPAARGGDDGDRWRQRHRAPLCNSVDEPS